jgi:ppGpp synthetase/RelA/SpoT-type nucleotidyltranferase
MEEMKIEDYYNSNFKLYERLAENLRNALIEFITENDISYHSINYRIKELDSYTEKIERKKYEDPFEQIEDFCGIRIICFYPNDLEKISTIIFKEFNVINNVDKSTELELDRFGYRSNHYIVKIKEEWAKAPNYRGLQNLKAEIQVRTILMHTWAVIEHKLAYKKKDQIPKEFRRKLFQLSALLEIADAQFQDLKTEKEEFQKSLISEKKGKQYFDYSVELNLDTLQAYLDFTFPNREKNINNSLRLLEELSISKISINEIEKYRCELKPFFDDIDNGINTGKKKLSQVGLIRLILDIKSDIYWNSRSVIFSSPWGKYVSKWRNILNK